jgi:hypothetical protein
MIEIISNDANMNLNFRVFNMAVHSFIGLIREDIKAGYAAINIFNMILTSGAIIYFR